MRKIVLLVAVALAFSSGYKAGELSKGFGAVTSTNAVCSVYFSPQGGCTDAIVRAINNARTSVHVQAYSFTSAPIAKALVDAHKRGAKVEVILDKSVRSERNERYSSGDFLLHSGIRTLIDARHAIAHNKVIVLDDETIITGSFNFTKQAEQSNAENLLIIRDPILAKGYAKNWQAHAWHAERYSGR